MTGRIPQGDLWILGNPLKTGSDTIIDSHSSSITTLSPEWGSMSTRAGRSLLPKNLERLPETNSWVVLLKKQRARIRLTVRWMRVRASSSDIRVYPLLLSKKLLTFSSYHANDTRAVPRFLSVAFTRTSSVKHHSSTFFDSTSMERLFLSRLGTFESKELSSLHPSWRIRTMLLSGVPSKGNT